MTSRTVVKITLNLCCRILVGREEGGREKCVCVCVCVCVCACVCVGSTIHYTHSGIHTGGGRPGISPKSISPPQKSIQY